jgi:hypothetical protein
MIALSDPVRLGIAGMSRRASLKQVANQMADLQISVDDGTPAHTICLGFS